MKLRTVCIIITVLTTINVTVIIFYLQNKNNNANPINLMFPDNYDDYNIGDTDKFNNTIGKNKIDIMYNKEFYIDNTTTKELVEIQHKYIDMWKKEIIFSIDNYVRLLNERETNQFESIQKKWEENIIERFEFEKEFIVDNILPGTSFRYEYLSNIRSEYRLRKIRKKYLTYIIENKNSTEYDKFKSLKFKS